jgi:hypothetical protein
MEIQVVLPWKGGRVWCIACTCALLPFVSYAQGAPSVPDRPRDSSLAENSLHAGPGNETKLDGTHSTKIVDSNGQKVPARQVNSIRLGVSHG